MYLLKQLYGAVILGEGFFWGGGGGGIGTIIGMNCGFSKLFGFDNSQWDYICRGLIFGRIYVCVVFVYGGRGEGR